MRSEQDPHAVNFLIDEDGPDPREGRVRADMPSILWNGGMAATALVAGPSFVTPRRSCSFSSPPAPRCCSATASAITA